MKETIKFQVCSKIDEIKEELCHLADEIWSHPEYNFNEVRACGWLTDLLTKYGFSVTTGTGGIETAFHAVFDSRKPGPHIGVFAEYDAVPGMGHSCGHNLMAAMAAGAGIGIKTNIAQLCGKISVFGTPAEEGGGGKVIMLENGAFSELDAALLVHSANETVVNDISYSRTDYIIDFYGKKAHGATWPEEGINALDPVLHVFQYINQMRLRWNGRGTILGVISKGGEDAIMIPEHCQIKVTVRSFNMKFKKQILAELLSACENIAQMTQTVCQPHQDGYSYEDIRNNEILEDLLGKNFTALGETIMPRVKELGIGCTDMGNVTHELPALQSYVKVVPLLRGHTKEFEDACGSEKGHQAIMVGAKAMAMTAVDLMLDPELMDQVKKKFDEMKKLYE